MLCQGRSTSTQGSAEANVNLSNSRHRLTARDCTESPSGYCDALMKQQQQWRRQSLSNCKSSLQTDSARSFLPRGFKQPCHAFHSMPCHDGCLVRLRHASRRHVMVTTLIQQTGCTDKVGLYIVYAAAQRAEQPLMTVANQMLSLHACSVAAWAPFVHSFSNF